MISSQNLQHFAHLVCLVCSESRTAALYPLINPASPMKHKTEMTSHPSNNNSLGTSNGRESLFWESPHRPSETPEGSLPPVSSFGRGATVPIANPINRPKMDLQHPRPSRPPTIQWNNDNPGSVPVVQSSRRLENAPAVHPPRQLENTTGVESSRQHEVQSLIFELQKVRKELAMTNLPKDSSDLLFSSRPTSKSGITEISIPTQSTVPQSTRSDHLLTEQARSISARSPSAKQFGISPSESHLLISQTAKTLDTETENALDFSNYRIGDGEDSSESGNQNLLDNSSPLSLESPKRTKTHSVAVPTDADEHLMVDQERTIHLFTEFLQQRQNYESPGLNAASLAAPKKHSLVESHHSSELSPRESDEKRVTDEPPYKKTRTRALEVIGMRSSKFGISPPSPGSLRGHRTRNSKTPVLPNEKEKHRSATSQSITCKSCGENQHTAALFKTIDLLRRENLQLTKLVDFRLPPPPLPPRVRIFHRVSCECGMDRILQPRIAVYLDAPHRITGSRSWHLQGNLNAPEQDLYLDQHKDVALLIYKNYRCMADASRFGWQQQLQTLKYPSPTPSREAFLITSPVLLEGFSLAISNSAIPDQVQKSFEYRREMDAPFHYLYFNRAHILDRIANMNEEHQTQASLLMDYIQSSFQASQGEADNLFSRGLVNKETLPYLFEPNMKVLSSHTGHLLCFQTTDHISQKGRDENFNDIWQLNGWSRNFDGVSLRRCPKLFVIALPASRGDEATTPIQKLAVYPLKYGSGSLLEELQARGEKFWLCRTKMYVSYEDSTVIVDPVHVSLLQSTISLVVG